MIFLFWEHILFTERTSLYSYIRACAHNENLASQKRYFLEKTESDCTKIKELSCAEFKFT